MATRREKRRRMFTVIFFITLILGLILTFFTKTGDNLHYAIRGFLNLGIAFFVLLPGAILYNYFRKARQQPLYLIGIIFYYLIIITIIMFMASHPPVRNFIKNIEGPLISTINFFGIIAVHLFLIKYSFVDVILRKRKSNKEDIFIILLTYVTLAVSFGYYYGIYAMANEGAFHGIDKIEIDNAQDLIPYLEYVYFSFITLTSVGYGDIYPLHTAVKIVVIIESVLGPLLLSFSLGMILSNNSDEKEQREKELIKKEILEDISNILEEHLKNKSEEDKKWIKK